MKVILLEDDKVAEVSDGYARNYLLPKGLAVLATAAAITGVEKRATKRQIELEQKKVELAALAEKLASQEIEIKADAGEEGKLFGSVTAADIAQAIKAIAGVEIDKRKIVLHESLKVVGEHTVQAKLFQDITATIKIKISAK